MAGRRAAAKRGSGDSSDNNDNANQDQPVPLDVAAFVAAITSAITTAVANAVAAPTPKPSQPAPQRSISTAIDPFDTHSMNFDTRYGKSQWFKSTEAAHDWKRIAIVTANAEKFTDLIEDRTTTYGYGSLVNIPTSGTGTVSALPRVVSGVDAWNADLKDRVNLLLQTHLVSLKQVQQYSGWIFGDEHSTLTKSADMIIKSIDPNATGNIGLANHEKIRNRQFSSTLNFILKNHLQRASFISLNPKKDTFTYTDEVTGRKVDCGLIKLWTILKIVKPQLVVDYREHEKKLESLTLRSCRNNVQKFLTTMETTEILINSLLPGTEVFSDQRYNTIMFNQLLKTTCKDFLTNVKQSRSDWIKNPKTFDQATAQMEFTNLYTNFSSAGDWDRADEEQAKIIALTTELTDTKAQIAKLSKGPKPAGVKGVVRKGLEAWRFAYTGKTKTADDVKYVFCKDHG